MRPFLAIGLLLLVSLAGCTSESDKDGDGLEDGLETRHWSDQTVELMDRKIIRQFASDPEKVDTDGDGLTDRQEFFIRTDPSRADTDEDGLTDCQEARHTNRTECEADGFNADEDGDGGTGTDPRKADSDPGPSAYKMSQPWTDETLGDPHAARWGDGLSDGDEWNGVQVTIGERTITVHPDPRDPDTDRDGLEDAMEVLVVGSNPVNQDSDGDRCMDGEDPLPAQEVEFVLDELALTPSAAGRPVVTALVLGYAEGRPQQSSSVAAGETVVVAPMVRDNSEACGISPITPWAKVTFIVYDQDRDTHLDMASHHVPLRDQTLEVWWHLPSGDIASSQGGTPISQGGTSILQGPDGSLSFRLSYR